MVKNIAAIFVEADGIYSGIPCVDVLDISRDDRTYRGPYRVIAHQPCQRWGRFWHGSTCKPHQFKLGDDDGCFTAALEAVQEWGRNATPSAFRDLLISIITNGAR